MVKNDKNENKKGRAEDAALDPEEQKRAENSGGNNNEKKKDSDSESEKFVPKEEYDKLNEKFVRLAAEFDNYRKRTARERVDLMQTAAKETISELLPILDDFDRAKKLADDESSDENFSEGVQLVYQKLHSTLQKRGLKVMESDGEEFDAELHEALTEIPAPSEDLKGKVVETVEKGYILKDRIIRHAKVVVGK
ncbi:MAG: nucleotide exchange factor GrpE [Bacteroidetes bacterium]|jgi:molecular chaperone GrpE|nr:nucleotide exchange factor GrpE [Bacteroidota bacterium]